MACSPGWSSLRWTLYLAGAFMVLDMLMPPLLLLALLAGFGAF